MYIFIKKLTPHQHNSMYSRRANAVLSFVLCARTCRPHTNTRIIPTSISGEREGEVRGGCGRGWRPRDEPDIRPTNGTDGVIVIIKQRKNQNNTKNFYSPNLCIPTLSINTVNSTIKTPVV